MKIGKFLTQLLPSFERERLLNDIEGLRQQAGILQDFLEKSFVELGSQPIKSKALHEFDKRFVHAFNQQHHITLPPKNQSFVAGSLVLVKALPSKLAIVERMATELFEIDITRETMTYRRAALVQYLSVVRFSLDFTSRQLSRMLSNETDARLGKEGQSEGQLNAAERKWFAASESQFLDGLRVYATPAQVVEKELNDTPDITLVADKIEIVRATVGVGKVDPLRMNLLAGESSLFYRVGLKFAEWQAAKYKAVVEERKCIQIKLLALQQANNGQQDLRTQKLKEMYEGALIKANYQLSEMEERYLR